MPQVMCLVSQAIWEAVDCDAELSRYSLTEGFLNDGV